MVASSWARRDDGGVMSRPNLLATVALASTLVVLPILHLRAEEPADGATRVTIDSSATMEPIAGARVWAYLPEDTWLPPGWRWAALGAVQVTRQDGSASLPLDSNAVSSAAIAVVAGGHRAKARYLWRPGEVVTLPPADPVMGVVYDGASRLPLNAATVRTYIPLDGMTDMGGHDHVTCIGPIRASAETDGAGRFRLEDGGDFGLLSAECAGYATLWVGVTLDEDMTAVQVLLPRASGLAGVVCDASGGPVAGAGVVAHPAYVGRLLDSSRAWIEGSTRHLGTDSPIWKATRPSTATTDEAGRFVFDALLPSTAYWVWSKRGDSFGMIEASTRVRGGPKETVDLVLVPLASVRVRVETQGGEPASGVQLSIYRLQRVPPYWQGGATDAHGEATFDLLPPGRYVVSAEVEQPNVEAVVDLPGQADGVLLRLK